MPARTPTTDAGRRRDPHRGALGRGRRPILIAARATVGDVLAPLIAYDDHLVDVPNLGCIRRWGIVP